jgi:adenine-specific DNA-methyltransferase
VELIEYLIDLMKIDNEYILDFFSGSATTAHAVMSKNIEKEEFNKFILVQLPEKIDENSGEQKSRYENICELAKERIKRAGKKIIEESGKADLDIGFRVLKLDSSNMKDVYFNPSAINQDNLFDTVDNIKDDRSELDLLFGVLIDWGVDLTLPITKEIIKGKDCYFLKESARHKVDEDSLCACFETDLDEEFIKELAARKMLRVVFRDSGFASDDVKDNVSQIFKQLNENVDIKVI